MPRFGDHSADCEIVVASEENVLDARHFNVLYGVFSSCGADFFAYVEPKMFQAFFLMSNEGGRRAGDLELTLNELGNMMPEYKGLRIGRSKGTVMAAYGLNGKIKRPPVGDALNEAVAKISRK